MVNGGLAQQLQYWNSTEFHFLWGFFDVYLLNKVLDRGIINILNKVLIDGLTVYFLTFDVIL